MARVTEYQIATAIAETILGCNLTPRTTIVAASAGNAYADVTDASHFVMQNTATFWDGTGEPETAILSVDTTTTPHRITFETPLLFAHAPGAVIATNLLDYAPDQFGVSLIKGDLFVFAAPIRSVMSYQAQRLVSGPVRIHIQVNVLDDQRGAAMHPNLWTKAQQHRCGDALSQIIEAVGRNPHLRTAYAGPIAQGIGENGQQVAEIVFDKFITRDDMPVFAAATHVIVRPRPTTA